MSSPLPVIVCGKNPAIATGVKAALLPEYEGIPQIQSADLLSPTSTSTQSPISSSNPRDPHPAAGASEIPAILRGESPPEDSENVGTKNYSKPPVAVILGGAYDDAMTSEMRDACKESTVPWLRLDLTKPTPTLGPETGYGEAIVARVKACLKELGISEGKEVGDGVYLY